MAGIKKLQKISFSKENVAGTALASPAGSSVWRGTGNQLDDQRKLNNVDENVGLLSDTTRTNISQLLGMLSLNSCVATFEQIQWLLVNAFGGPLAGATDGGTGTGALLTANLTAGVVTSVTVNAGGTGYTPAPTLMVYGGTGPATTSAVLTPVVSGGIITSVTVTSGGTGYLSAPGILVIPNGAGSDSIYTTTFPTSTAVDPNTAAFTVFGGDDFEAEKMEYALTTKIELSGEAGAELKVSADIQGRQVAYWQAGMGNISILNPVEDILFQKCKIYLDAVSGAYGTTQVANSIEGLKLTFEIKWKPEFTADGTLYYSLVSFTGWTAKGELLYIHNANVTGNGNTGAKGFFRNQTAKLLRLDFTGNALATPGTTYTTKRLIIDLPIKFDKPGILDNKDGTSTVAMGFFGGYDFTAGNAGKAIVVNELRQLYGLLY